ncbi:unnamed protein product [Darwinula stevensoni]|uniref:Uncharacterized protein n=1 Tax=Darwinula stevensoni TaxID=69355 RepID=A0A7R9A2F7_9CRUS|nr:unnamed protein product [Darwinula stevensoni]CAG0889601.1 unnamed protein product [Darwinula stevensoni]
MKFRVAGRRTSLRTIIMQITRESLARLELMTREEHRLKTFGEFKLWPKSKVPSPKKLAEAGLFCCGNEEEPDLTACYVCLKMLAGWEKNDDPWLEHGRNTNCLFIQKGKKEADMTLGDFMELDFAAAVNLVDDSKKSRTVDVTHDDIA